MSLLEWMLHQSAGTESADSQGRWEREDALGTLSGGAAACRGASPLESIPSLLG